MTSFTWDMNDPKDVLRMRNAVQGEEIYSPTFSAFNLRWNLAVIPNKRDGLGSKTQIFLCLRALSPKVKSVQLMRTYSMTPLGIKDEHRNEITHDSMNCLSWGLSYARRTRQSIENSEQFAFKVHIDLFGVFDVNGNDITHKYLEKDEEKLNDFDNVDNDDVLKKLDCIVEKMGKMESMIKKIESRMDQIVLRQNEEQKENMNSSFVMKELKLMNASIKELSAKININPKSQNLKNWLKEKVGLPQMFDVFIENGIEDLSTAKLLTSQTLNDMGIEKIGERMKILHQVALLNEINNEGKGTHFL